MISPHLPHWLDQCLLQQLLHWYLMVRPMAQQGGQQLQLVVGLPQPGHAPQTQQRRQCVFSPLTSF